MNVMTSIKYSIQLLLHTQAFIQRVFTWRIEKLRRERIMFVSVIYEVKILEKMENGEFGKILMHAVDEAA